MPITSPCRARNQRAAIKAARYAPINPQLIPTTTPHSTTNCQGSCINGLAATANAVEQTASDMTRRTPNRSMSAAANGPIAP